MYIAKVVRNVEYDPWKPLLVGVFQVEGENEKQIGEYERTYHTLFRTFYSFHKDGKDYALYARDSCATRVMALPSCTDIGGEERTGFCPVDYYVPCYIEREYLDLEDQVHRYRVNEPRDEDLVSRTNRYKPLDDKTGVPLAVVEKPSYPVSSVIYYPFGFVAGCNWGDDSSWKVQYLDLSNVEHGIIRRDERFGYIAMSDKLTLKDSIDMTDYEYDPEEEWSHYITIAIQRRFDLRTGKVVVDD